MIDRTIRVLLALTLLMCLPAAVLAQPGKEPKPDTAPAKAEPAKPEAAAAKPEAAPAKPEAAPAKPETPATHKVKKGPLKITVDVDGVFEARSAAEIAVRLDEYMPAPALVVVSAVKHGAASKRTMSCCRWKPRSWTRRSTICATI